MVQDENYALEESLWNKNTHNDCIMCGDGFHNSCFPFPRMVVDMIIALGARNLCRGGQMSNPYCFLLIHYFLFYISFKNAVAYFAN